MIQKFIDELSTYKESHTYENQFINEIQRNNLYLYLSEMMKIKPTVMLLGEAPGYLGCKLTGIPFTDENILISNKFVPGNGKYKTYGMQKEDSATAIWQAFEDANFLPLLWNSFPFHPHNEGEINTNRTPKAFEIRDIGVHFISELCNIYNIQSIYAVGRKAENTVKKFYSSRLPKDEAYIRHPAHGGQIICKNQIKIISKIIFNT